MGLMRYGIGILCFLLAFWMFYDKKSHTKWYTCLLAVIFIAFTAFTLDFVITTFVEGFPQGAFVALLLFGLVNLALFVIWRESPRVAKLIKDKAKNTSTTSKEV